MNAHVKVYHRGNPRLAFLGALTALLLAILLAGLAWHQLWHKHDYDKTEQHQILRQVVYPGPRGDILDRQGRLLVGNRPSYSVELDVAALRGKFREEFTRLRNLWRQANDEDAPEAPAALGPGDVDRLARLNAEAAKLDRPLTSDDLQRVARLEVAQDYLNAATDVLGRPRQDLEPKAFETHYLQKMLLPFPLLTDLSPEEFARFNEQMPVDSPLQASVEAEREYPYGSLAAHVLGWVDRSDDLTDFDATGNDTRELHTISLAGAVGSTGLEEAENEVLRGATGSKTWVVDPSGFVYARHDERAPTQGAPLHTSLDLQIQRVGEDAFDGPANGHAKVGGAALVDVRTGEVLALVSKPNFDLNTMLTRASRNATFDANKANDAWVDRATQGLYPPGSTFKLLVTLAGLRNGALNGNLTLDCPARLKVGSRLFEEHDIPSHPQGFGKIDLTRALEVSSNVFFYQAGMLVGAGNIAAEARRFGLGNRTGIEIEETKHMIVPDPEWKKRNRPSDGPWTDGDTVNLAIGQSYLRVTALQMACFAASLARDETVTHPTLLHDPNRDPTAFNHGAEPTGLTTAQRKLLLDAMEGVTTVGTGAILHGGGSTHGTDYLPGIRVAGKTGTAQYFANGKETNTAWFVGFAPVDNPRVAIAVVVEGTDPNDNYHGGITAGPIAGAILREYFKEYPAKN